MGGENIMGIKSDFFRPELQYISPTPPPPPPLATLSRHAQTLNTQRLARYRIIKK